MKRLFLLAALGLATATSMPAFSGNLGAPKAKNDDTVLVKLPNGASMSLVVKNTAQLKSFQNYSLDSLMIMLNKYIAEAEKMEKKDISGKDYTVSFRPSEETKDTRKPESVNITFKGSEKGGKPGAKGLNIDVKYNNGEVETINLNGITSNKKDTVIHKTTEKHKRFDKGWEMDLGFNTFTHTGENMLDQVGLKPWGSRFISFNRFYQGRIGGKNSPLYLRSGLEFAFNNYMFDKNYVLKDTDVAGSPYSTLEKDARNLQKSKLATSTINLPLMAVLDFKTKKTYTNESTDDGMTTINTFHKEVIRIGIGGFVGYRIGAHTKIKYTLEGDSKKDKDHGNFNLEDLQYGAKVNIGYRGLDLFANYHLNDLFKEGRGPNANVISFGVTFFN